MTTETIFWDADALVVKHGDKLIGELVFTSAMGEYPGGWATVTEILPDRAAPEIAFQVEHPSFGSIGVFGNESVWMAPMGEP